MSNAIMKIRTLSEAVRDNIHNHPTMEPYTPNPITDSVFDNLKWEVARDRRSGRITAKEMNKRIRALEIKHNIKCRNYKDYKAVRPPKCGCEACNKKWEKALHE